MRLTGALVGLLCATAGWAGDAVVDQAAYLFFNRHLGPDYLDSAAALLRSVLDQDQDEQALYLLSRIYLQRGDDARAKSRKLEYYCHARALAETLISVNERNPAGHMWWAVAQGRVGQTRGVLNSLFMIPGLKRAFNRTLELDPNYVTAYDAWGVFYYEVPAFAGGDLDRSVEYLTRGLELDPNYTLLRLDLAKTYLRQNKPALARAQLEALIATENPTYPADFFLDDRPEAESLLHEIKAR